MKNEEKNLLYDYNEIVKWKNAIERDIRVFEEQIQSMASSNGVRERKHKEEERKKKLAEHLQKKSAIECRIGNLDTERISLETKLDYTEKDLKESKYEQKALKVEAARLDQELKELENSGHHLAIIDTMAPIIAEQIHHAMMRKEFNISPIGPVGNFLKLNPEAARDENLSKLIETEISTKILKSYLCNDDHDRKVLWDIFNKVYGNRKKPMIYTTKFLNQKHRVQRVDHHKTLMDYIEIMGSREEKIVLFNHLVDSRAIEAVVVKTSQDEAKNLCTYIQNVPKNLKYCITKDFYRFFPPSNTACYRSFYIEPIQSSILGSSIALKKDEKMKQIEELRESEEKVHHKQESLLMERRKCESQIEEIKSKSKENRKELTKCNTTISRLKADEDSMESSDILQEKLEMKREELCTVTNKQERNTEERETLKEQIKVKIQEYNSKLKEVSKLRQVTASMESEKSKIEGTISVKRKEISNHENMEKRFQDEINYMNVKLTQLQKEEKKYREKSLELNTPEDLIPSGTALQLDCKLRNIRSKRLSLAGVDNPEYLEKQLIDLHQNYESQKKRKKTIEDYISKLEHMSKDRQTNYLWIRFMITKMISRRFNYLSRDFRKQLGCEVYLKLEHAKRELNWMFKNNDGDNHRTMDVNSLSGGEKSYVQVNTVQHSKV